MKRFVSMLLLLTLLMPLPALAAKKIPTLPKELTLTAGQFELFDQAFTGVWESSDPAVAGAEPDVHEKKNVRIIGFQAGEATLTLTGTKSSKSAQVHVTVLPDETAGSEVPALIENFRQIALREWTELGGKKISKELRDNKYNKWWGYAVGWCGAFASYCLESAGVPLDSEDSINKLKPLENGDPHGVRAAGVPKLDTGYTNLGRVTKIPRPGYLVIYGQKNSYAFKHVGLVTDVTDRGNGAYTVCTVEGSLGSRVKRICYVYSLTAPDNQNMSVLPKAEQTQGDSHQYTLQQNNWYVTEFCQTWY